ncbi:helix-turn-helix transcriptional regulator [Vibrio tritonius]|uniref:helix-turn-helix transcriptional regulator n=1 Tax=Vibrio tritonius TaxID=1435069 RepID=UPI0008394490|nr:helix-turn-helix transcriptional regulator [Vibrio tritonius]
MDKISNFNKVAETEYAFSTDSINLMYYDLPKHFCDEYRSYDSPRLCTIISGSKTVSINQSERFVYGKEQFILLPPHSNVYMSMPEYTKALVYEFSDHLIDDVNQKVSANLQIELAKDITYSTFFLDSISHRLTALQSRMQEIMVEEDANMKFLVDITSQELVYELMKIQGCHDIIQHHQHHPINKAIRLMNSTQGNHMSISDIAEEVDMSLSNFSQKFKLITNQCPKDYLTKLRLKKSRQYLRNLSVTDTAYETGYDNISHYIRLFKKEYGITPKQYQLMEVR